MTAKIIVEINQCGIHVLTGLDVRHLVLGAALDVIKMDMHQQTYVCFSVPAKFIHSAVLISTVISIPHWE